jgi:hypothetical protein
MVQTICVLVTRCSYLLGLPLKSRVLSIVVQENRDIVTRESGDASVRVALTKTRPPHTHTHTHIHTHHTTIALLFVLCTYKV